MPDFGNEKSSYGSSSCGAQKSANYSKSKHSQTKYKYTPSSSPPISKPKTRIFSPIITDNDFTSISLNANDVNSATSSRSTYNIKSTYTITKYSINYSLRSRLEKIDWQIHVLHPFRYVRSEIICLRVN